MFNFLIWGYPYSWLWLRFAFAYVGCEGLRATPVSRPPCFTHLFPIHSVGNLFCVFDCLWVLSHFSSFQLFVTLWTVACQAPLSMSFSRQENWSVLPFPWPPLAFGIFSAWNAPSLLPWAFIPTFWQLECIVCDHPVPLGDACFPSYEISLYLAHWVWLV